MINDNMKESYAEKNKKIVWLLYSVQYEKI